MEKPNAPSCEKNREPILEVLRQHFGDRHHVLEIGSGTGQHAVRFAAEMPYLTWHTSDVAAHHEGIRAWIDEAGLPNVEPPQTLDVTQRAWPAVAVDAVFSANTAHIMHWPMVEAMFAGVGRLLGVGGLFALYGPFHYNGQPSAPSNARFDGWLRTRDPGMGVRDFEAVDTLAGAQGLTLFEDYEMPADNRTLVWRREPA